MPNFNIYGGRTGNIQQNNILNQPNKYNKYNNLPNVPSTSISPSISPSASARLVYKPTYQTYDKLMQNKKTNIIDTRQNNSKIINHIQQQTTNSQQQTIGLPMPEPYSLAFVYNNRKFDLSKYQRQTTDYPDPDNIDTNEDVDAITDLVTAPLI